MNQGIYKLVYSRVLHMMVPVSEATKGHVSKSGRRIRKQAKQVLQYTLMLSFSMVGQVWAEPVLPAGVSIRDIVNNSATLVNSTANSITFRNNANAAIVNFNQLNIQRGESFNVLMNANQSFLGRIHDINPSSLNGAFNAAGNLYFINANGIIIGKDATFNVGSLYAGTLNITDELFQAGFVNDQTFTKAFELVGTLDLDDAARTKIENAQVLVEGGAQINTANNGKVMLFAPNVKVEKEGIVQGADGKDVLRETLIRTPEGQTILAAGKKIYLKGAADPAGFLVEVDAGGTAVNLGKIVAERGNITMMGLAVNQGGTLSASTSVRANGSIKLIAQDRATESGVDVIGSRNGAVTLEKGSVTEVVPDYADKEETIVSQPFKTSDVTIEASLINIDGKVSVKGGNVTAKSEFNASSQLEFDKNGNVNLNIPRQFDPITNEVIIDPLTENPVGVFKGENTRRIYLGENASIDVSGVDAVAPMSRNQLEIQLFSDQLKDNPILRDSGLFRQTVYVDARKGTDLLDIQPFLDLVGVTVAEKMTNAGTVTLSTNQDLIINKGAVIDVSGGSTTYTAGTVRESQLVFNGKLVPISEAKTGVAYQQVADSQAIVDPKWGTVKTFALGSSTKSVGSYFEGWNAGTVDLTTPIEADNTQNLVLAGQLLANTKVSREQLLKQEAPEHGTLKASANHLVIDKNAKQLPDKFNFNQKLPDSGNYQSVISTDFLANGFNDIDFSKVTKLDINTQLNLNPHGKMVLSNSGAGTITNISANIFAPNSDLFLQALRTNVANNVTISTAGIFTNDSPRIVGALTREVAADGGNITAGLLSLGTNVTLDASAGAWVDNKGVLHKGEAGDISFKSNQNIDNSIRLQSYGFDHGGRLAINFINVSEQGNELASTLNIANNLAGDFTVNNEFFSKGGFSEFALSAFNVNIGEQGAPLQQVYGVAQNWYINSGYLNQVGGQSMSKVAKTIVQADYLREAVSLDFTANRVGDDLGTLNLAENTTLRTDRGGSVSLSAGKQVNVLGDITTPSGNISIRINDIDTELPADQTQAVFIGENAYLSAAGTTVTLPDSQPKLLKNKVYNAGTIRINERENTSEPLKGATIIKQGAVLDVSGVSIANDTKTLDGFVRETLHGDAGTISISGTGALLVDGDFKAAANGTGRDGSLSLTYNGRLGNDFSPLASGTETVLLTNNKQLSATNFSQGDAIKDDFGTNTQYLKAQLSAEQIEQGGFANVSVKSFLNTPSTNDRIELADGFSLNIAGNLKLESPILHVQNNGNASLQAGHITLKNPSLFLDTTSLAAGTGTLTTQSKQLHIEGLIGVSGTQQVALNTELDIHGQGTSTYVQDGAAATESGITANGEITLTARQIYPDSGAKLTFEALGPNSKVTVNSNGKAASPVLSAGGELTLKAADVVQNGVLTAPFGRINLVGSNSVTLTSGSSTSISGSGQNIPFGITTTGGEVYNPSNGATRPLVEKAINIDSDNVDMQQNAKLDLSAGGDMFAYEWVPGLGGSQDILAQPNTYAVMPTMKGEFAPTDLAYAGSSAGVGVGQTVYLSGVPGLPAGTYTLLPARYALVPGAYVVQAQAQTSPTPIGKITPQQDGTTLTSGYFADSTGARDANWSTFRVMDGAVFRPATGTISKAPSQYILTSANTYFNNPLKTEGLVTSAPDDVGKLSLKANQLALNANVIANTVGNGDGLQVDISSNKIRVVNAQDNSNDGSLQLTVNSLNNLNAESVLLGGTRTLVDGVQNVTTVAESVTIENDNTQVLRNTEFIATANKQVVVNENAVIDTGVASAKPGEKVLQTNGEGALLALSSKNNITYSRLGGTANAAQGELIIENGSTLKAGNSAVVDATQNVNLDGSLALSNGGKVTLSANRILIGDAPQNVAGLGVNADSLAAFGQLKSLTLNSYSNIDTFGAVNIGNSGLDLTLNAAGIVGHLSASEVGAPANNAASVITANTLTIKNNQDAVLIVAADSSGRALNINANTVRFEGEKAPVTTNGALLATDQTHVQGYSQLNINAGEVRTAATGQTNLNVAEVNVNAGRITSETAGKFTVKASDTLNTTQNNTATLAANKQFGGQLTIEANNLNVASKIESLSGQVNLKSNTNLVLADGANISANSQSIQYYTTTQHLDAGKVSLNSVTGNVNVNAGANVTVTSTGDAKAGTVSVNATQGTLNLEGGLNGSATGTGLGGNLAVDVGSIANLSATNQQAAGFSESRHYRVRTGDVSITGTGNQALSARDISVATDAGKINVSGDIIATAPKNSKVGLYANQDLTLASTANIQANSTKAGEEGGKVELFTQQGALNLQNGSTINVAGGAKGAGGDVHLRAPRTGAGAGNGVAVNALATAINGAKSTVLEAFKVFSGVTTLTVGSGTGATLGFTTVANDVSGFMANKDSIVSGLGKTGDNTFHLRAGTEIQSSSNLTVGSDWNLYSENRAGNEPGILTLRAANNLNLNGSISDGFTTAGSAVIGNGDSWAYRLVAGSDFTSASPLGTIASEKAADGSALSGNVILANNKLIRTGTGDIEIAAGGDLIMRNAAAAIYTAGTQAPVMNEFEAPITGNPLYLTQGGSIRVLAQGNIVGAEPVSGRQLINQWLFRQGGGNNNLDTTWWVRPDLFRQSLATFGGGDIELRAGGDISNFSASAPTTARYDISGKDVARLDADGNPVLDANGNPIVDKLFESRVDGGGDLTIAAGNNINSGVYFAAKGDGNISAGGAIQATEGTFGTVLALQDGHWDVSADKHVTIDAVINPTLVSQSTTNATILDATGRNTYFNSYSVDAGVKVVSTTGDASLGMQNSILTRTTGLDNSITNSLMYTPANIEVAAYQGDVNLGDVTLLPASNGNLNVFAANDIGLGNVSMSDADPASLPGAYTPISRFRGFTNTVFNQLLTHSQDLLHKNDTQAAMIVANNGDVFNNSPNAIVSIPKATKIVAGNDVTGLNIALQNNRATDISVIKAGRDVNTQNITVAGPGELLLQAGRNIDLTYPNITTITTTGNARSTNPIFGNTFASRANPALPKDGASITLQAGLGLGAAVQAYINQYVLPSGAGPVTLADDAKRLAEYRKSTADALTAYMRKRNGDNTLSDETALAQFNELDLEAKTIFVNRHLSSELVASGRDFADAKSHARGEAAIATLFPTLNTGDILLFNSKVSTNSGGSIDMLAPGGLINVGVPGRGGDIGIITEKGGAIRAMSDGDFQVNQSKVITQFGSDIAVWSTKGTIDAGRGSKTATSVPERIVQTDAFGNTIIEVRGVAAGSGIRAQSYDPDGPNGKEKAPPKGDVVLIAPIVDAGEAGIEAGNLLLVAPVVLNAANIQVQGVASGVPIAATSAIAGVGAGLSPDAVNSATQSVANSVAQSANNSFVKPTLPSIISVDVIGIGN